MAEIPVDILRLNILPRFPAKSVVRFMCVCKQWLSFLSTQEFFRMHLRHITSDQSLIHHKLPIVDGRSRTYHTLDCEALGNRSITSIRRIPFEVDPINVKILATLDGLVCVGIQKTNELLFWNPLTGAYNKLSSNSDSPRFYTLFQDAIGFYLDSANDYKLLQVVLSGSEGAFIYSKRYDSWRKIQCLENHELISHHRWSQATFLDSSLYFVVRDVSNIESQSWIICFDVNSEKFREVQHPPIQSVAGFCESLVVVNGEIHLCVCYANGEISFVEGMLKPGREKRLLMQSEGDVWKMVGTDGWMKVASFSRAHHYPLRFNRICVKRSGNWLVVLENNKSYYKIDMEDLATNFWVNFFGNWTCSIPRTIYVETIYVETLVSPNP